MITSTSQGFVKYLSDRVERARSDRASSKASTNRTWRLPPALGGVVSGARGAVREDRAKHSRRFATHAARGFIEFLTSNATHA